MTTTPAVEVTGLIKDFGTTRVLNEINISVNEHEFVSLLGPSGCGKSTLLRIISGFETPTRGTVRVHGRDFTNVSAERRPTNMVFQRGALFPHMTVAENIAYSLRVRRRSRRKTLERVEELLALVKMESFGGRPATELSGGQVQRVALARALAAEPSVLLLDEPLSALDLKLRQQMQLELRRIQQQLESTFIFVTHDQTEALTMSDRIAIMNDGGIVQYGTPREIYREPASAFASTFIGETNLMRGTLKDSSGTGLHVQIDDMLIPVKDCHIAADSRVMLSVRPEDVSLVQRPMGDTPFVGEITEMIYLGSSVRCSVVSTTGTTLWAELRGEEESRYQVGDRVGARWAPESAHVWENADA